MRALVFMVLGILIRSSLWITGRLPMQEVEKNNVTFMPASIFCAISSVSH